VRADGPVERVGDGLEVCEERYAAFERGEFALGDGVEARVVEGTACGLASILFMYSSPGDSRSERV
jgi:hypothetical protein